MRALKDNDGSARVGVMFKHREYTAIVNRALSTSPEHAWCLTIGRRLDNRNQRFAAFQDYFGASPDAACTAFLKRPPYTRDITPASRCWLTSIQMHTGEDSKQTQQVTTMLMMMMIVMGMIIVTTLMAMIWC